MRMVYSTGWIYLQWGYHEVIIYIKHIVNIIKNKKTVSINQFQHINSGFQLRKLYIFTNPSSYKKVAMLSEQVQVEM